VPTADTIYALSTAPGRAAIAIVRVSGPACLDIYGALCPNRPFPQPRTATLRKLYHPEDYDEETKSVLDSGALVLYFPGPNTVTGENILELHVHGGPAIVKSLLEAISKCTKSRPRRRNAEYSLIRHAEPGEFTKRAFYNGRMDLMQAEALGEALAAETEQQRKLAIMGADSGLSKRYDEWRQLLLYARGELEALIDFSEDQHFDESPTEFMSSVSAQVDKLAHQIRLHIHNASRGELLRSGIKLALLGAPNAGKSSLLNLIVGREAAIVSPEAGTTRDIVDVSIDLGGWLCRFGDMAGLRSGPKADAKGSSVGQVEAEGIRRAKLRAMESDVVIAVLSVETSADGSLHLPIDPELHEAVGDCAATGKTIVTVINKADLCRDSSPELLASMRQRILDSLPGASDERILVISCRDAELRSAADTDPGGLQQFLTGLKATFESLTAAQLGNDFDDEQARAYWTASLAITHRQSMYLTECLGHLEDFLSQNKPSLLTDSSHHTDGHEDLVDEVASEVDIVTAAEHLRYAAACLAKITGKGEGGDVEDVLGVVFEK
jgi:tRNA modification GTPase